MGTFLVLYDTLYLTLGLGSGTGTADVRDGDVRGACVQGASVVHSGVTGAGASRPSIAFSVTVSTHAAIQRNPTAMRRPGHAGPC